jgi:hypothetical protein
MIQAANTLSALIHGDPTAVADYFTPGISQLGTALFNPYQAKSWGAFGNQLLSSFVPPALQFPFEKLGATAPTTGRRKQPNRITDMLRGVPGIGGVLAATDPYFLEAGRFARPRYGPGPYRDYVKDVADIQGKIRAMGNRVPTPTFPQLDTARSMLAYHRYKEYESRVKYGIGAREGRTKLSPLERAVVLAAVLQETDPRMQGKLPTEAQFSRANDSTLTAYADNMEKYMFNARSALLSAAARAQSEYEKRKKTAAGASR